RLVIGYTHFLPAVEVLSPYLDAVAASRAAETIRDILPRSEASTHVWVFLAQALLAVCKRLPPADSASHINRMVDFVVETRSATKEQHKVRYNFHAKTLSTLSGQVDADVAARAADAIIAILDDSYMTGGFRTTFIESFLIPDDLASVAERLDAPGSL